MTFIKGLFLFLFIGFFSKINAQNFELGKVSIEELQEKEDPIDSTAAAVILFNKAQTFFTYDVNNGFSINTEQVFRIKIYKKEGLKWANYKVSYYVGYERYNDDKVEFDDCVTYNVESGRIVRTKLTREGKFNTSINKYWKEASIAMPNVRVGSVIEYRYILKSENIVKFPVFNFQQDIPVNYSEYVTKIPGFFIYKAIKRGTFEMEFESEIARGSISYANKNNITKTKVVSFGQVNNRYMAKNIPALKEESFVDNMDNYRASICNELEQTHFPDERAKDYSLTWEGVAKNVFDYNSFGRELNKDDYLEADLKRIISEVNTQSDKLDAIFKFVQHKMNFDGDHSILTNKGVKKAYQEETGNAAEINLILIAMLNSAGIKADPVLISTRGNGVPVYPNRTGFNSVIAAAEIGGKQILMDATNKYSSIGILPLEDLNWTGRLIKEDGGSQEVNLVPKKASSENVNLVGSIDDKGKIIGQARAKKTDYEVLSYRERKKLLSNDAYIAKTENALGGILIENYTVKDNINLSPSVIESFDFVSNNHCEIIAGKMYINPLLFYTDTKNPFVQEKRQMPIYFGYPRQMKFNINIEIPKGYKVESLPNPIKILAKDGIASFSFNLQTEGNKIQISVLEELNLAMVTADYYDALKEFYQKMIDKQNEKIVLTKI